MPPKQTPSDDPPVLESQVRQAQADLNKLTVKGELIINEAKAKAEPLEKRAKELRDVIIPQLIAKERQLTQSVADLTREFELKQLDSINAQAALSKRELDLNVREQRIVARERQQNIHARQTLT